ncbi:uncharacterized protein LOC120355131 [Nilaparvata lugens]|uniref:uncharacterized protein LOC120355131 n=1 Tax=Nilaparvata lugens TaxID=108931 RepID=UPI00193CF9FF|nr:uncharacterized protein LOC120355131 [Nilaparvata lugens]
MNKAARCRQTANSEDEFVVLEEAFKSRLKTLYYNNACKDEPAKDFHTFLSGLKDKIVHIISRQHQTHGAMKFNLVLEATYFRSTLDKNILEQEEFQNVAFKTPNYTIFSIINLPDIINQACITLLDEESKFEGNSSGWSLLIIDGLLIRISRHIPLRGSSYISLSPLLSARKAIINPINMDQQCFKWAILAKHVQGSHPERVNDRYHQLEERYNFSGIGFPTTISQIDRFEKDNPGVSVNIYGVDEKNVIFPRRVGNVMKADHFDLLLLCESNDDDDDDDDDENNTLEDDNEHKSNSHYCY